MPPDKEDSKKGISLSRQDVIDILEEIATNPSNSSARIQAVRTLEAMRADEEGHQNVDSDLYTEFEIRRKGKIAA